MSIILKVEAKPLPPCLKIEAVIGSSERALRMAESTFGDMAEFFNASVN